MAKIKNYIVRTILTEEDQQKCRQFLMSPSGMRVLAWLRENLPPRQGSRSEDYVAHSGMIKGYEEALFNLCRIPGADIEDLNSSMLDTDSYDENAVDVFRSVSEGNNINK